MLTIDVYQNHEGERQLNLRAPLDELLDGASAEEQRALFHALVDGEAAWKTSILSQTPRRGGVIVAPRGTRARVERELRSVRGAEAVAHGSALDDCAIWAEVEADIRVRGVVEVDDATRGVEDLTEALRAVSRSHLWAAVSLDQYEAGVHTLRSLLGSRG